MYNLTVSSPLGSVFCDSYKEPESYESYAFDLAFHLFMRLCPIDEKTEPMQLGTSRMDKSNVNLHLSNNISEFEEIARAWRLRSLDLLSHPEASHLPSNLAALGTPHSHIWLQYVDPKPTIHNFHCSLRLFLRELYVLCRVYKRKQGSTSGN